MYPVKIDWIPGVPAIPYRHGVGMWEMVVMHETANDNSTAASERINEGRTFQNAFVHEFIDPKEIIQVSNPNYIAYGAGGVANQRAIHLELCHAHSQHEFDLSFDMWCQRAAVHLWNRDLGVSVATPSGGGTLWGHFQVSKYLGGTTHGDPIAYLAKWGKTWEDVVYCVYEHYDILRGDRFSDVAKDRYSYDAIMKVSSDPYYFMTGYTTGDFSPEAVVTRAEMAAALSNVIGWVNNVVSPGADRPTPEGESYHDVPENTWYFDPVSNASGYGFMVGFEDGLFHPLENLTREQVCVILNDLVYWILHTIGAGEEADDKVEHLFTDVPKDRWSYDVIRIAVMYGFVDGFEDGTFHPADPLTREQLAVVLARFIDWV